MDPLIPGRLDGKTILRFAHAFESGGGTERYLDDLDRSLLARNPLTIIRLHLTRREEAKASEERVGHGTLIRVPLPIHPLPADDHAASYEPTPRPPLKQRLRDAVLYHPVVWSTVGQRWAARRKLPAKPGQAIGAGLAAAGIFRTRRVDLVMMHFFGGADAEEVITQARSAGIPVALLNHYSNDRLDHLAIRKHAMLAQAVAGVNGLQVPAYVRNHFTNLSDGIDTAFFSREHARRLDRPPGEPVILLPARVTREKGQLDLVHALTHLREAGLKCCIAFAGRVDSTGFIDELNREIERAHIQDHVHFLGGLDLEKLRDWYGACSVMGLPTYHHEGLPRIILEAQSMETPVVAYATGGVADGIDEGKTGFLVPTGDRALLFDRLTKLLTYPSLRSAMAQAGRKAAEERFSLHALAERHEAFYAKVIAVKRKARRAKQESKGERRVSKAGTAGKS